MGRKTRKKQELAALEEQRVIDRLAQKKNSGKTKRGVVRAHSHPIHGGGVMTREMVRYRRYFLRDPDNWVYRGKSKKIEKQRTDLARYLFGKYHVPRFLEETWNEYEIEAERRIADRERGAKFFLNWYISATQGKSVYKLHSKGILSKKETHQFLQAPDHYSCNMAMWWAKAMCEGANLGIANRIVQCTLTRHDITSDFWISVMRFFVHNPVDLHEMNDLLDFIRAERQENPNFKMKGRSLESVRRKSEEWHRHMIKTQQIGGGTWSGMDVPNWTATSGPKDNKTTWRVEQITSGNALVKEGREMRHCVAGYKNRCMAGATAIFSMHSSSPINSRRNLTIEVRTVGRTVVQARGKANRRATRQEINVLRTWAHANDMNVAEYI